PTPSPQPKSGAPPREQGAHPQACRRSRARHRRARPPRDGRGARPRRGVASAMTAPRIVELVAAVAILGASVWFYRRRDKADSYGSQGAVVLLVVGAIM